MSNDAVSQFETAFVVDRVDRRGACEDLSEVRFWEWVLRRYNS
jgi:hypothetical protein